MTFPLLSAVVGLSLLPVEQDWEALPIPTICAESVPRDDPPALLDGHHLRVPEDDWAIDDPSGPELPLAIVRRILEDGARGSGLEIHPSSALLAVRGTDEAVAAARRAIADLDRATRALEVEIAVWHIATGSAPGAAFAEAVGGQEPWRRIVLGSGESGMVGERRVRSFVSGYRVEVAHDSGVADPDLGQIVVGRTLHLEPERVDGGNGVHVRALLDLAELVGIDSFDPGTPDIDRLEQPRVETLQLAFAGTAAAGEALRVDVKGSGIVDADGTWWIGVETTADPADATWRVADFALLERPVRALPFPTPGALLDVGRPERPNLLGTPLGAFDALQQATLSLSSGAFPRIEAVPRLLVGPADDPTWAEVDALQRAAEASRTTTHSLSIRAGELDVRLPVSGAGLARVLFGLERTLLTDYDVTLAPETWMPVPETGRTFDGLCVEGRLTSSGVLCRGWSAASDPETVVERDESSLGRFQLPMRTLTRGRHVVPLDSSGVLVAGGTSTPTITVGVGAP